MMIGSASILVLTASMPGLDAGSAQDAPTTVQERAERLHANGHFTGGPVRDFEEAGRNQLIVLLGNGVQPDSKVLDIGCGMLRGGYWMVHFLRPGCYFGIEPNEEMLELGVNEILGEELVLEKRPRFDHNVRWDFSVFEVKLDFVVARSIWTHAAKAQITTMLDSFVRDTTENGVFLTSYIPAKTEEEEYMGDEWVGRSHESDTGGFAKHSIEWIRKECRKRNLRVKELKPAWNLADQRWLRIRKQPGEDD